MFILHPNYESRSSISLQILHLLCLPGCMTKNNLMILCTVIGKKWAKVVQSDVLAFLTFSYAVLGPKNDNVRYLEDLVGA